MKTKKNILKIILLDNNLEDKLCICNINNVFWSNIKNNSENELYFQKCLTECPVGYEPETLTHLCIEKLELSTTLITTIINEPLTSKINTVTNIINTDMSNLPITKITTTNKELSNNEITSSIFESTSTKFTTESSINEITTILGSQTTEFTTKSMTNKINSVLIESPTTELTNIQKSDFSTTDISISKMHTPATIKEIVTTISKNNTNTESYKTEQKSTNIQSLFKTGLSSIESTGISLNEQSTTHLKKIVALESSMIVQKTISTEPIPKEQIIITRTSEQEIIDTEKSFTDSLINKNEELDNNNNKDFDDCFVIYNDKCYNSCPEGTCISEDDIELKYCNPINSNIRVYNDICFNDLDEITNNIKSISSSLIHVPSGQLL